MSDKVCYGTPKLLQTYILFFPPDEYSSCTVIFCLHAEILLSRKV